MNIPKFHGKKSLMMGIFAGWFLVGSGMFHGNAVVGIIQMLIGCVLSIHCYDTLRYYKKHRIVKIEKTGTHRIVTKE